MDINVMLHEVGLIDSDDLSKIKAHIDDFAPLIERAFHTFYGVPHLDAVAPSQALLPINTGDARKVNATFEAPERGSVRCSCSGDRT